MKNLVLIYWPKNLSANQIVPFFKCEYIKNRLTIWADFLWDNVKEESLSTCEYRISWKNLVLKYWPKNLSANQIAPFFKCEYLENRWTIWADFLWDDVKEESEKPQLIKSITQIYENEYGHDVVHRLLTKIQTCDQITLYIKEDLNNISDKNEWEQDLSDKILTDEGKKIFEIIQKI